MSGIASVEQAGETLYAFAGQLHCDCPGARSLPRLDVALVVFEKRLHDCFSCLLMSFFPVEGKRKDAIPAWRSIIGTFSLRGGRGWEIHIVLEVVAHIVPEIIIDPAVFFLQIESGLRGQRERRTVVWLLLAFAEVVFFVCQ